MSPQSDILLTRKGRRHETRNDAEAICEAVRRPSMRFAPIKNEENRICRRSMGARAVSQEPNRTG